MILGLVEHEGTGGVVACTALLRRYRDVMTAAAPQVWFLYLHVDRDALAQRLEQRRDHFMPAELLDAQLALIEPPDADERAVTIDATAAPDSVVRQFLVRVGED